MYDVCIIGGGASGLAAAVTAARRGYTVSLIDKNKKAGKKLYATGNGKCNLTNRNLSFDTHYHSSCDTYQNFLHTVLGDRPCDDIRAFADSVGVATYATADGYVYPCSNQASSVVWALLDEARRLGVSFFFDEEVNGIRKQNIFHIDTEKQTLSAANVILACGSPCYPSLGGTPSGYTLAESFGHTYTKLRPALCGIRTAENLKAVAGVRARAKAILYADERQIAVESGEIQFTDYGLSGIAIFNLSSEAGKYIQENKSVRISLDLLPHHDEETWKGLYKTAGHRTVHGALNGLLHDKLASYYIRALGYDEKTVLSSISGEQFKNLFTAIKHATFAVEGLCGFDSAQVCAGGIALQEINAETCESRLCPGLYIVGELPDVDGACGGYNLTFAFLSGIRAGEHIHVTNQSD